ncbi:MAG TPA: TonB family protein [Candidatus Acidoferrum sp.]
MSIDPGPSPQNNFGFLEGCFVEGNVEQRARERRIRRRALTISIAAQSAILTVIILVPLFGKPERIALAMTPIPPYYPSGDTGHHSTPARPNPPITRHLCATCYSPKFPAHPQVISSDPPEEPPVGSEPGEGRSAPPTPWGINMGDGRRQPERPAEVRPPAPHRVVLTHLESAMLIRRIEPIYPPLARQIRREGQVELHAIIAADGTIQSLQVVNGDPLFLESATDAVRQWRYRATVLNGQPVEIETYITVIYTLQR